MTTRAQAIATLKAKLDAQRSAGPVLQITAAPVKQDRELFLQIGRTRYQVADIADAVAKFELARDRWEHGASKMPRVTIVSNTGAFLYGISYNGRVWSGIPGEAGSVPLDGQTDEQRAAQAGKISNGELV